MGMWASLIFHIIDRSKIRYPTLKRYSIASALDNGFLTDQLYEILNYVSQTGKMQDQPERSALYTMHSAMCPCLAVASGV